MVADGELTSDEQATLELVQELVASGNLHPLIRQLRSGETGPERARDALAILGELSADLLVQVALDTLIDQYVEDAGAAHQTRRKIPGAGAQPEG